MSVILEKTDFRERHRQVLIFWSVLVFPAADRDNLSTLSSCNELPPTSFIEDRCCSFAKIKAWIWSILKVQKSSFSSNKAIFLKAHLAPICELKYYCPIHYISFKHFCKHNYKTSKQSQIKRNTVIQRYERILKCKMRLSDASALPKMNMPVKHNLTWNFHFWKFAFLEYFIW